MLELNLDRVAECQVCFELPRISASLPCFHTICNECFEQLAKDRSEPCFCPTCRTPIPLTEETPKPNPFIESLSLAKEAEKTFDPNQILCGFCDTDTDSLATKQCVDCSSYSCEPCEKDHHRRKIYKMHRFISIDDALKKSPEKPLCKTHQLAINTFCTPCNVAVCAECVVSSHKDTKMHTIEHLSEIVPGFRDKLTEELSTIASAPSEYEKAIEGTNKALDELKFQKEEIENKIRIITTTMVEHLRTEEAKLIQDLENSQHVQTKELELHKGRLKCDSQSLTAAHMYGTALLQKGDDIAVASNRHLLSRMKTLRDMSTPPNLPLTFTQFFPTPHTTPSLGRIEDSLSKGSKIHFPQGLTASIKQPFCFSIENASEEPTFRVTGPAKLEFKTKLEGDRYTITASPTQTGDYHISVLVKGYTTPESSFLLKVSSSIQYRRNYAAIEHFQLSFRDHGAGDSQLDKPCSVAVNKNDDIIVADTFNHRIQIFDRKGRFLLNFGSSGSANGQFNLPVCVICSPKGDYVVSDFKNHRIQIFDSQGNFKHTRIRRQAQWPIVLSHWSCF